MCVGWRKRSIPTHSERFNPPTFETENGLKTAKKRSICGDRKRIKVLLRLERNVSQQGFHGRSLIN